MTALAVMALAGLYFVNPGACALLPPCFFHALTGLHCPGCGSTRALHQLAHGHLLAALRLNPLTIGALPLIGYLLTRRSAPPVKPVWIWVLLGVVIAFGVLRNLPAYPFTLLAPQT
jgi:hypothetical protein